MMIEIKTAVIERQGEIHGMIQMPGEYVVEAWAELGGVHQHGTQCTFPIGTDATTVYDRVLYLHYKQLREFRRMDKERAATHG